jgi:deoxyadenosine/deoxycytidine kinase
MRGLIVVEGLIGVGKTTLCRILEREWGARLVLEPAEDNPFLVQFYADPERFAFPAQMFYLANRYAQQVQARQTSLFHPLTVCDYLMAKDGIFAEMTLTGHELTLYRRFAGLLDEEPLRPDFVLFLDSETEVIRSRIARRGIPAEQIIPATYLDDLRARYYRLWDRWDLCPVHVLRTDTVDYVRDPGARSEVLEMVSGWLSGRPVPGSPPPYRAAAGGPSLFGGASGSG